MWQGIVYIYYMCGCLEVMPVLRVQTLYVFGGEDKGLAEGFHLTRTKSDDVIYILSFCLQVLFHYP